MSCGSRGGEADDAGDGSRSWAEKKGRADDGALPDHCQRATDVGLSTHPVAVNTMGSSHRPEEQPATRFLLVHRASKEAARRRNASKNAQRRARQLDV